MKGESIGLILQSGRDMEKKKEFYIVAYDIKSNRHRARFAKLLQKYGVRANYSVFECMFTPGQLKYVKKKTLLFVNRKSDSVIFYPCCLNCYAKIEYVPLARERAPGPMVVMV